MVPANTKSPLSTLVIFPDIAIGSETIIVLEEVSNVKLPVPAKELPELTSNVILFELAAIVAAPSNVINPE